MLTTKTEYAIRGLIEVAGQSGNKPVAIRKICEQQHLPAKYMEQIFRSLKKTGILKSVKGAGGGYLLTRNVDKITLKEIMDAIEDEPVKLECCGEDGYREFCVGSPCSFFEVWEEIGKELDNFFSGITLSRFLSRKETK